MSALTNLLTHRELIENLVMRDVKSRYKQSTLGIAWAVLSPLFMALIYSLVGEVILKQDVGVPFAVYSYFGLLFWNLFAQGVLGATESLVSHISLITKVYFPREVFPIATVVGKLVDFMFGMVGLIPLMLFNHVTPSPTMILIIPMILVQIIFTAGLGMLLACVNLFYRDVRYVVALVITAWIYLVPIIYPLSKVPEKWLWLYLLNPMAVIIDSARNVTFPELGTPHWDYIAIDAVLSVIVFMVGYAVFKRYEPQFAESI